jgi:hypothetical protein
MKLLLRGLGVSVLAGSLLMFLPGTGVGADNPDGWGRGEAKSLAHHHRAGNGSSTQSVASAVTNNFEVLGHTDLGAMDTNGDVWVHRRTAYVGTWADPCTGRGVKVVDVTNLQEPELIGTVAARPGTSAEDMVARFVFTRHFFGDLLAVGIQRCGPEPELNTQQFGIELWDVSRPASPTKLSELGLTNGGGGVHELDLFQRGRNVYVLAATPFSEFFDPVPGGDFRIIDVTDPRNPQQVGEWGAAAHGLTPGPFFGIGSFGATLDHSARASSDGRTAYVSYWDAGVLTLDISDVTNPVLVGRTTYARDADGDAHSVSVYDAPGRKFLLQNDEDFDPTSPSHILFGAGGDGIGQHSPSGPPVWSLPDHKLAAGVVAAAGQGCSPIDYPVGTSGKIAVVRTIDPFSAPVNGEEPLCSEADQEAAAETAGAAAVVHDFISEVSSPQWFDFGSVGIPVLFTDHATAVGMVAAGAATLQGQEPAWGFLRVFDARTGVQVAKFDALPHVHELPAPPGAWSVHNNEVVRDRSYASWYSHGVVALDLTPLKGASPGDPTLVGQFVPEGAPSHTPSVPSGIPAVWGVAVATPLSFLIPLPIFRFGGNPVLFVSDMNSGLWIVRPTGPARP